MFTDLWYSFFMTYASQSYRVHLLKLSAICQLHLNKTGRKVKTKFCFFNQSVVSFSFFGVCVCVCVCVCVWPVLCRMQDLSSLSRDQTCASLW